MRPLSSVVLLMLLCADLRAQVIDTASVPKELVQALLGGMGYGGRPTEVVVGRPPDPAFAPLVPPSASVIGGLVYPRQFGSRYVAVLVTPDGPDSAMAIMRRHLERGGWSVPEVPEPMGASMGGFGVGPSDARVPVTFCRDSLTVSVTRARRTSGGSFLTVTLGPQRNTMCDPQSRQMFRGRAGVDNRIILPSLRPPVDAVSGQRGESSGSDGMRTISAQFDATMGASALVSHFAAQFVAAGWTAGKISGDAEAAIQVFTRKDAKGQSFIAVMTDSRVGDRDHEISVKVQLRP